MSGNWEEESSPTTASVTQSTTNRPTTVPTTQSATRPTTVPTTRPTAEHTTEPQNRPTTTTGSNVELAGENEQTTTNNRPPTNRPWWSEYHTQRPEVQQPCKPGSYQASKDSCQNYYQCKNGRYRKYSCTTGSQWNRYAGKCDSPRNANCNEPGE